MKKLEQLSEEVLEVRAENTHLALQLQVYFGLQEMDGEEVGGEWKWRLARTTSDGSMEPASRSMSVGRLGM